MIQFLKSLNPKTRVMLALILGGIVIVLFWVTLFGFLSTRRNMERVNQYNVAIGLARQTDANFQLAISKGKNFAILKDSLNKARTLEYFGKAQATFGRLVQLEQDPEGRGLLYRLGAGLHNVEFSLGILTSTAKKSDSAERLYKHYLKDITIDFDNASQVYVNYLEGKVLSTQSAVTSQTKMDLLCALIGAFLGLAGMGLSYSIAYSLNQALQNETTLEERHRVLNEVTEEAIMIHDQGIIVDANPSLARMLGYSLSEIIGKHVSQFQDASANEKTVQHLQKGYPAGSYEIKALRKDGSTFPLLVHGHDLVYKGRKLRVSSGWDLTEWKKAEQALQESEERFRRFAGVTKEGILIHEGGIIVDLNQALQDMTGRTAAELIGTDGMAVLSEESARAIQNFRQTGYPTDPYEITLRRKDGTMFPVEVHGVPFKLGSKTLRVARFWDLTERKKAEEALRKSEGRFQAMLENSHEGITLAAADGTTIYISPSNKKLTGFELEERIGRNVLEMVHPDDLPHTREILANLLKNPGKTITAQIRIRHKSGQWRVGEFTASNLLDNPDVSGILINSRDITEKVQAEEALKHSEEYFRNLIENSHDIIAIVGEDRVVRYMSPSVKRILGYEPSERVGENFAPILHPDDLERMRGEFKKLLATQGVPVTVQFRLRHKDGSWRYCESTGINLLQNPSVRGLVYNIRDITEKVQAEEKFKGLIDNSYDVISITGKDRAMSYISPSVKRVLGYEPSERLGQGYAEIMHPEDVERIKSEFAKLLGKEGASWTVQFRLKHKDGSWRYVESTGTNLLGNPAVQGIVYNLRDVTEKKLAEDTLRKSEENFRNLIEKSPDAILVHREGKMVYANPKLLVLTGYDEPAELLGKEPNFLVHPEDQKIISQRIQTLLQGGKTSPLEMRLIRRDGAALPVETASITIQFEGKPAIMVNLRDITARKQAEAAIQETQERYRSLVESMPDAVMVHDEENILYVNPSAVKTFGALSEEEFTGKPVWMVVPAESRDAVRARVRAIMEKGSVNELTERKLKRLDGTPIDVLVTSVPFYDRGRRVVLAIFLDITARKTAEEESRKNQERFRKIFEDSPIGIGLVNLDATIATVNPRFAEIVGYTVEELAGKKFAEITHPEDVHSDMGHYLQLAKGEIPNYNIEKRYIRKDGKTVWGDLTVTLLRDEQGVPIYGLGMVVDITGRKDAESKAQKYQRLAALGEMAAGMAHEIRNPTAAISAQAQYLLKKVEGNGTAYEQLKDIVQQCDRLETLVHDTLDYSPEKKFEERTEIPAKDLLQKALWLARTQFGPSHARVQVKMNVSPDLPILKVHPTRLERVLVNLILNAFQAMPEGGHLLLEADRLENSAILRVVDDGKGIKDEEMARLFEPFYTSRKMGSGLGLSICQKIVEEHQGQIKVERVQPHGAAFVIELPFEKEKVS